VDQKYLEDPLDLLVLVEVCRFGNEIITAGAGTKDIVKGSWKIIMKIREYSGVKNIPFHQSSEAPSKFVTPSIFIPPPI
jgi:hypothetical protein